MPEPEPAPLSPAEACVLLSPNLVKGGAAVKATLLLLLTTGVLRIEETEQPGFFRNKTVAHLRIAAAPKNPPPEVAALLDLVRAAQADGGKIADVVRRGQKAFGPAFMQFIATFIVPALIARGLLIKKKILFTHYFRLTAAGETAQARIKSDLFKAADVARLLKSDPAAAAALARTLGTTMLLSDKLTRQFKPLADALRARGADTPIVTDGATTHGGCSGGFDFGSFDGGSFDLGSFEAGAIDAVHAGMGAFDAGFSEGGGGGHDGGGGGHH
jgi:hypothetical protein